VVDVNDVYAQYSGGVFGPAAIQAYIKYAAASMSTKYVLLVGGDTYDYRNDLGLGAIGFIPTLYATTDQYINFAPADSLYGDVDGDGLPEVAIGRFPVRTAAEADSMVRKTLAYRGKSYAKTAMFAADKDDGATSFKAISQSFASSLPAGWTSQQANIGVVGVATARASLISAMNAGTALVNFVGHSGYTVWTFDGLFSASDAAKLTNAGRPLVASQFGCWNSYFVSPYYETLAHRLLLSGDQGAAAVMGAAALTEVQSDEVLGRSLIPLVTAPGARIGAAVNAARREAAATGADVRDVVIGWTLLGDPTLVIQP
jgi:hypothetical protein